MCGELKKMVEIRSAGGKSSPAHEFSNALFPNNGGVSEWEYESKSKIRTHSDYFLFFPHFNRLLEIGAHFFTSSDFHSNIFSISSESECVFFSLSSARLAAIVR